MINLRLCKDVVRHPHAPLPEAEEQTQQQPLFVVAADRHVAAAGSEADQRPSEHLEDLLGHLGVEVEEVWHVVGEQEEHVGGDLRDRLVVEAERRQQHLDRLLDLRVERAVDQLGVDEDAEAAEGDAAGETGRLLLAALQQDPTYLKHVDH